MHPDNNMSQRKACKLIRIARGTFQRWEPSALAKENLSGGEYQFFESPEGMICLHRILLAVAHTLRYGSSGIRGVQEFLELSQLDRWMAASTGALHGWISKMESTIIQFGQQQQSKLSSGMDKKKISICQDENFHEGNPCLVVIEPVSNFILVEKMVQDRSKDEWKKAVEEGMQGLNVEIVQSTSDEGMAILSHVKNDLK